MSNDIDTLSSFNSDNDPLQDLQHRVEQMEASEAGGYGAAIEFYKRIIARIELADDIAVEGWARMRQAAEAANDDEETSFELAERLRREEEYLDKRLKELGEDEEEPIEPLQVGEEFIYTPNGSHVYVSKMWKQGRWEYAEFRFVDGDEMFSCDELVHYIVGPKADKYGFWKRLSNA